jgi:hypothetical protein
MKQCHTLPAQWIDSGLLRRFGHVARETRQAGILFGGRPSDRFRNDVVDVHAQATVLLGRQTVDTALSIACVEQRS